MPETNKRLFKRQIYEYLHMPNKVYKKYGLIYHGLIDHCPEFAFQIDTTGRKQLG